MRDKIETYMQTLTFKQRIALTVGGLLLFLFLFKYMPLVVVATLFLMFFLGVLLGLIQSTYKSGIIIHKKWTRKTIRTIRTFRQFYQLSEETEFFLAIALLLVMISFAFTFVSKNNLFFTISMNISSILFMIGALFDIKARASWLAKKTWAKLVGKILLAGYSVLIIVMSSAIAKQYTIQITNTNPENFVEFTNFYTTIISLLLAFLCTLFLIFLFATIEITFIFIASILYAMLNTLFTNNREQFKRIIYRFTTGKKMPKGYRQPIINIKGLFYFSRPFALFLLIGLIVSFTSDFLTVTNKKADGLAKTILVKMHYHANHTCTNISKNSMLAILKEKNLVSIATYQQNDDSYFFRTEECIPMLEK